eukprot:TRINITY_DN2457_c0_g1_i1.p1 TRINITY_DN2457_c0_g1~~TRINITY_DN2457_c0_g1_i1.p1  ORF type:complete len:1579 (+),score=350.94 TRINITY_DN2457_c0_g1_i1:764-5500(+)
MERTDWEVPNPEGLVKLNPPPLKTQNMKRHLPSYVQASSLHNAFEVYDQVKGNPSWIVRFQVGNTGTGIYPALTPVVHDNTTVWKKPKLRIDLSHVPEMNLMTEEPDHYSIGAATTYARFMDFIDARADRNKEVFKQESEERRLCALRYLAQRTAGRQIRNRASLGGNTMMVVLYRGQRDYPPFPSDLCTGLLAVGTRVVIVSLEGDRTPQTMSLYDLITKPPTLGKFILVKYLIPKTKPNTRTFTMTYKTAIRHTMAHSYVNGGITVDVVDGVIKNPILAFGGIGPTDLATQTARLLDGAPLTQETLTKAAKTLHGELAGWAKNFSDWKKKVNAKIMFNGEDDDYLVSLGVGYLYKFLVTLATAVGGPTVDKDIQDIGLPNFLPPNYAKVTYADRGVVARAAKAEKCDDSVTLAHLPVIKYEAYAQATGEVTYVREAGPPSRAVYFSWVYARRIGSFKYNLADKAENVEEQIVKDLQFVYGTSGVLSYITYSSMQKKGLCPQAEIGPGVGGSSAFGGETLLINGNVTHCVGDRIGLIVASSDAVAQKAAELIMTKIIKFEETKDPVYLKMEDYQANPNGPPNPEEWKPYRIPFPWGGVCYPKTAPRDFDSDKRPIQNVVERPLQNQDDAGWEKIVRETAEKPPADRFAELPFYIDGKKDQRVTAKCYVVKADHRTHEQMHFYLETNAAIAEPTNAGITIHASTQSPSECQAKTAAILGVRNNHIDVQVKQIGGGYGGKTVRSPYQAAAAAVVCKLMGRAAKLAIERETDSAITGRRHAYFLRVYLAVVADENPKLKEHRGTIAGFYMQAWSDAGYYFDCAETVLNVAIEDSDGPYYAQLSRAEGQMLRTNKIANTAYRAFGHASIMAVENAIEAAGHSPYIFGQDGRGNSTSIRIRSMYKLNQETPYGSVLSDYILDKMFYTMRGADWYRERVAGIRNFNRTQRWKKRGHCLQPAKYKVGFELGTLEQGHAIVNVFKDDGSILIMHDGVEIGQGLSTKVIQIAATELGLPVEIIQIGTTGAKITPNPTSTGASSGSEIKGGATRNACQILRKRLEDWCHEFYDKNLLIKNCEGKPIMPNFEDLAYWKHPSGSWSASWPPAKEGDPPRPIWPIIISAAYSQRVDLSAEGFYTNPYFNLNPASETPQVFGFVYCCAYSEVEVDVLTGDSTIVETRLVVDAGKSMNPAVDVGQIEGAFLQGVGSILSEHVMFQPDGKYKGAMVSDNTWVYKPPFPRDIPLKWWTNIFPSEKYRIRLNQNLIMSSKAMGEPPFVLSTSVYCALKEAIYAARLENLPAPDNREWFLLPTPVTPQDVRRACAVDPSNYVFSRAKASDVMVPCATELLLEHIQKNKLNEVTPPSLNMFASLDRSASIHGKYSLNSSVKLALSDSLQHSASASRMTKPAAIPAVEHLKVQHSSSGVLSGSSDLLMSGSASSLVSVPSSSDVAQSGQSAEHSASEAQSAADTSDSVLGSNWAILPADSPADSPKLKSRKSRREKAGGEEATPETSSAPDTPSSTREERRKDKEKRRKEREAERQRAAEAEAQAEAEAEALRESEKSKRKSKEKEKEKSKEKSKSKK